MNSIHIPLGQAIESVINTIQEWVSPFTRPMAHSVKEGFNDLVTLLIAIDPLLLIPLTTLVIYLVVNRSAALFNLLGLSLIYCLDLWAPAIETFVLVIFASVVTITLGVPLGILIGLQKKLKKLIIPLLDIMQTMPAYVYLIPVIPFFGLGAVTAVVATMIFAMPPVIRLTSLGIDQVSKEHLEAADAFGSSWWQKLCKVQIPLATNTILNGINQGIMLSLSMVVLSALVGAKGLGSVAWRAIQRLDMAAGFEAGVAVVILAILLDRMTKGMAVRRK